MFLLKKSNIENNSLDAINDILNVSTRNVQRLYYKHLTECTLDVDPDIFKSENFMGLMNLKYPNLNIFLEKLRPRCSKLEILEITFMQRYHISQDKILFIKNYVLEIDEITDIIFSNTNKALNVTNSIKNKCFNSLIFGTDLSNVVLNNIQICYLKMLQHRMIFEASVFAMYLKHCKDLFDIDLLCRDELFVQFINF
jgi:hypothetical protein